MLQILLENLLSFGMIDWILIGIIYVVVISTIRMLWFLIVHRRVSHHSPAYSQTGTDGRRILILGDSTAIGVGATKPEHSLAGKLGINLPTCEIRNLGKNGARTMDVIEQLASVQNERFDLIIISVGGNDVWHFTPLRSLKYYLMLLIDEANRISDNRVLFLIYSNMGSAPLFPKPLRAILGKRAEKIRDLFIQVTAERGTHAIDLSTNNNSLTRDTPLHYYAEDRIHPSDTTYALWYKDIWHYIAKENLSCDISDRPNPPMRQTLP